MSKVTCNAQILTEVAGELGLPRKVVEEIVSSQFEFVKNTIEGNTYDSVRLAYLGTFKSKPKEVQILNYLRGMTPDQQVEFKRQVRQGKFKINYEDEPRS